MLLLCVVEFKALVSVRVVVKEKVMSWELGGIVSEVCVLDVVAEGSVEPGPKKSCLSAESAVVEPDHHGCERQGLEGVVGVEHVCPAGVGFVTQTEHHAKETDAESEDCACLGDSCCALCSPAFHKLRNHAVRSSEVSIKKCEGFYKRTVPGKMRAKSKAARGNESQATYSP